MENSGKSSPNGRKSAMKCKSTSKQTENPSDALARFTSNCMFFELLSVNFTQLEENVWVNNSSFPYNIFF